MDPTEVDQALAQLIGGARAADLESQTLDFKLADGTLKAVLQRVTDASVCFINSEGGHVVLGVDDKGSGPDALRGVPHSLTIDILRKGVFDRSRPPITSYVTEHEVAGARIVVITVPPGVTLHSNSAGLATRRLNNECLPFSPDQQREVLIARGHIDWSAESSSVPIERLSSVEFGRLRSLLVTTGRDHLSDLDDTALLSALRLLHSDGHVTRAGVLLLGHESVIARVIPGHGYSYQYRTSSGSEASSRSRGALPLLAAIESLMSAVDVRQQVHPLNVAGGVQLQLADYPADAVRELVVNAFIHRSYEANGSVDIEHSPQHLVIMSPGPLVAGVTPENILTHPSTPRNRLLTEAVTTLGMAERTGQGIDRAYREMLRVGKEPPSFEHHGSTVRALLTGGIGNDAFARFINGLAPRAARDVNVLLTLSTLRRAPGINAVRLAPVIQRTVGEAQTVLMTIDHDLGLIEATRRTASSAAPNYRLRSDALAAMSRAVTYHRRGIDDLDQKVIDHVREYGSISNRTIQRMFDLHVYAARDLIADLRERDVLVKIGEARGGRGVRYGRGRAFPE